MFMGDCVVCQAWSHTDDSQEIPYLIRRLGKPASQGGTGYKWYCNCPSRQNPCKHISVLKAAAKNGTILFDKRYTLSDFGREIFSLAEKPLVCPTEDSSVLNSADALWHMMTGK